MKMILTLLAALIVSNVTYAAPAAGQDPNMLGNGMQAGVFATGAALPDQVSSCPKCQHRNSLNLSDKKDIFQPGAAGSSSPGSNGSSGTGEANQ